MFEAMFECHSFILHPERASNPLQLTPLRLMIDLTVVIKSYKVTPHGTGVLQQSASSRAVIIKALESKRLLKAKS